MALSRHHTQSATGRGLRFRDGGVLRGDGLEIKRVIEEHQVASGTGWQTLSETEQHQCDRQMNAASMNDSRAHLQSRWFELRPHDRVALVGNPLAERMNLHGHFESLLHSRFPNLELAVRNFGWPGDEAGLQQRPDNYTAIDDPFLVFGANVFFCFFGYNESFTGRNGLVKFKEDLRRPQNHALRRAERLRGGGQSGLGIVPMEQQVSSRCDGFRGERQRFPDSQQFRQVR